jgi:hypothetical protein
MKRKRCWKNMNVCVGTVEGEWTESVYWRVEIRMGSGTVAVGAECGVGGGQEMGECRGSGREWWKAGGRELGGGRMCRVRGVAGRDDWGRGECAVVGGVECGKWPGWECKRVVFVEVSEGEKGIGGVGRLR